MEIHDFTQALQRASSQEDLKSLAPDGLVKYLEQEKPDLKTLAVIANRVRELGSSEKDAVQELFDRRFALDGLHPEVRGGLIKAATQLGISDHQDLAYRLAPVLALVATANEAMAVVNSGHLLTREQTESVANIGEESDLVALDLVALLTQARTQSADELGAMARQLSAPEVRPREEMGKGYFEREDAYSLRAAESRLGKKIASFFGTKMTRQIFDLFDGISRLKGEAIIETSKGQIDPALLEMLALTDETEWRTILNFTKGMEKRDLDNLLKDFKSVQSLPGEEKFRKLFDHLASALAFYGIQHQTFFDTEGKLKLSPREYKDLRNKRKDFEYERQGWVSASGSIEISTRPIYGSPDQQPISIKITSLGSPVAFPMGFDFSKLESLSITSDSPFPSDLPDLPALKELHLRGFDFSKGVPEVVRKMKNLTTLSLTACKMEEMPAWFEEERKLVHLDLSENHIRNIPYLVLGLENLKSLNVTGNPAAIDPRNWGPIRTILFERSGAFTFITR